MIYDSISQWVWFTGKIVWMTAESYNGWQCNPIPNRHSPVSLHFYPISSLSYFHVSVSLQLTIEHSKKKDWPNQTLDKAPLFYTLCAAMLSHGLGYQKIQLSHWLIKRITASLPFSIVFILLYWMLSSHSWAFTGFPTRIASPLMPLSVDSIPRTDPVPQGVTNDAGDTYAINFYFEPSSYSTVIYLWYPRQKLGN